MLRRRVAEATARPAAVHPWAQECVVEDVLDAATIAKHTLTVDCRVCSHDGNVRIYPKPTVAQCSWNLILDARRRWNTERTAWLEDHGIDGLRDSCAVWPWRWPSWRDGSL